MCKTLSIRRENKLGREGRETSVVQKKQIGGEGDVFVEGSEKNLEGLKRGRIAKKRHLSSEKAPPYYEHRSSLRRENEGFRKRKGNGKGVTRGGLLR